MPYKAHNALSHKFYSGFELMKKSHSRHCKNLSLSHYVLQTIFCGSDLFFSVFLAWRKRLWIVFIEFNILTFERLNIWKRAYQRHCRWYSKDRDTKDDEIGWGGGSFMSYIFIKPRLHEFNKIHSHNKVGGDYSNAVTFPLFLLLLFVVFVGASVEVTRQATTKSFQEDTKLNLSYLASTLMTPNHKFSFNMFVFSSSI